jgi:hypothetical protein
MVECVCVCMVGSLDKGSLKLFAFDLTCEILEAMENPLQVRLCNA